MLLGDSGWASELSRLAAALRLRSSKHRLATGHGPHAHSSPACQLRGTGVRVDAIACLIHARMQTKFDDDSFNDLVHLHEVLFGYPSSYSHS